MSDEHAEPQQPVALHVDRLADGRYELGEVVGAGGMGIVRRARDVVLERDVAIKLLADNLASDDVARERFLREGRAAARIDDPFVVPVYDVGDDAGRPYLVMPLIDGPSLAAVVASGGLAPEELTAVASDALRGLAAAHAAGVLHRDVKPGNLLRGTDGRVLLTDLGVAEAAEAPGLTNTGFVIGTGAYLAPERRRGEPASVATDLYALGATLRELRADRPDQAPVDALIRSLLADDPAARPADADEARRLLHEAATAESHLVDQVVASTEPLPVEGEPPTDARHDDAPTEPLSSPRTTTSVERWPVLTGVAAAAVAVVAIAILGSRGPAPAEGPVEPGVVDAAVAEPASTDDGDGDNGDADGGDGAAPSERARELAERLRDRAGG